MFPRDDKSFIPVGGAQGLPDAARLRWQGVLPAPARGLARAQGMDLAYDPAQAGWVVVPGGGFVDDADPVLSALSGRAPLAFRAWEMADLAAFRALLDDAAVWRHLPEPYPAPLTPALAADLIALSSLPHHQVRAVLWHGVPVGQVRLEWAGAAEAELSYWLGRAHWGRGLGRAAVRAAVAAAFGDHPRLARLTARVRAENPASPRILLAAGFAETGLRADGWLGFVRGRG